MNWADSIVSGGSNIVVGVMWFIYLLIAIAIFRPLLGIVITVISFFSGGADFSGVIFFILGAAWTIGIALVVIGLLLRAPAWLWRRTDEEVVATAEAKTAVQVKNLWVQEPLEKAE